MPSAGELLRAERMKRNRTLSEIANQTCISKRYLEAIEVDQVQDLPGEFFYKSFLRQYAEALNLDAATTANVLASAVPCTTDDPLPVMNEVYEKAQVGKSSRWNVPTGAAIGLLVVVLAACSGLYAMWQHIQAKREAQELAATQQQQQQPPPAAVQSAPAPQAQPQSATPETTSPAQEPAQPAGTQPGQTPATPAAQPPAATPAPEPGKGSVDLAATEPVWVSLSSEGKTVFTGVLEPSQSRQFAIGETAKLTAGNAGGLEVRWNGKPIGSLGPRGQVRTVVFSANNFEIVPPKPKSVPTPTPATPQTP